ncbi:MAG: 23S rRNA (pseudouridine(1915)-N(3))-methyltransferase RlmH [Lachnospiraceae bacterium]|nr:23S rRNA (pseudouridine(1915)-N(3))-methyltransferase RlmH [Lachnospiraceae bacterium]
MQIILHIDLKKFDTDYEQAINEYFKRTSAFADVSKKLYKDFAGLSLKDNSYKFVVVPGKASFTSPELAKKITDISISGYSCIEFIIPDEKKHDDKILNNFLKLMSDYSYEIFNLTSFSMCSGPTAVALSEQIYRAYTINNNINYHK